MAKRKKDFGNAAGSGLPKTLAEVLFYFPDPSQRRELEEYRIQYEAKHGPTDLTKHYVSLWPAKQRNWLYENYPQQWFDGLPPFVQCFFRSRCEYAAEIGNLDDLPNTYVLLYVSGGMDQTPHKSNGGFDFTKPMP